MPPGSIDALTRLVLTNAIYFKGEWAEPIDESSTKEEDFFAAAGGEGPRDDDVQVRPGRRAIWRL